LVERLLGKDEVAGSNPASSFFEAKFTAEAVNSRVEIASSIIFAALPIARTG
jgi:hypothetical protein